MSFIEVRHNMEVAHRLYELPGKCENIHGHSMWVDLRLHGPINQKGILGGLSFGDVKKAFRGFLDDAFDHHLLLNVNDPWATGLWNSRTEGTARNINEFLGQLPGLMTFPGDPTTENLAKWIAKWAVDEFKLPADVTVHETSVNSAGFSAR